MFICIVPLNQLRCVISSSIPTRSTPPSTQIDQEVDAQVERFRAAVQRLTTVPGINELSACVCRFIENPAEIGRDMSCFPTAGDLISWAGCARRTTGERVKPGLKATAFHPDAQKSALAQDHPGAMRLGRRPQEGRLSPGAVSSPARPARGKKGDWCRRRFDPDGGPSPV